MTSYQKKLFATPKLVIYIPPTPVNSLQEWEENLPNREFVVQAESSEGNDTAISTVQLDALKQLFSNVKIRIQFQDINNKPITSERQITVVGYKPLPNSGSAETGIEYYDNSDTTTYSFIELKNGDYAFPLQAVVALPEKYRGKKFRLVVTAQAASQSIGEEDLLQRISFNERSPPTRTIDRQVQLCDPLNINFLEHRLNNTHFFTMTVENRHHQDIVVTELKVHLAATSFDAQPNVPFEQYLKAEIVEPNLPVALLPREQHSFVICLEEFPLNINQLPSLLNPAVLITWFTPSVSQQLQSQFSLPIKATNARQLLLSVESESSCVPVNSDFTIRLSLTNISNRPVDLILELELPNIVDPLVQETSASSKELKLASSPGILFAEKEVNVGLVEAFSEVSIPIRCVAVRKGLFQLRGMRVREKSSNIWLKPKTFAQILVQ